MKDYTENYKNIIIPIVEKYISHASIILYGSRARKDFRQGSDIDIALNAGSKIDELLMSKLIGVVQESNLVVPFDIVDFYDVSSEMQKKIIKEGVVWKR